MSSFLETGYGSYTIAIAYSSATTLEFCASKVGGKVGAAWPKQLREVALQDNGFLAQLF